MKTLLEDTHLHLVLKMRLVVVAAATAAAVVVVSS
jgi:hypothetical protein